MALKQFNQLEEKVIFIMKKTHE